MVGTKNFIKFDLFFFESIELSHQPKTQTAKNEKRYMFMLL